MDNKAENKAYKDSLKATSLLGSVQVVKILVNIVQGKIMAVLLGTEGMGIYGLLNSTIQLLTSATNLGLGYSAVKNIAEAKASNNETRLSSVISIFRFLVRLTGLLGMLSCIILSPWLSQWAFGSKDYTIAFVILSVTLLLTQLCSGQTAVMQGLHKYKFIAKSNLLGQVIGLIITVPLYYIWGIDAIVPVLIVSSVISLLLSIYFYRKLDITHSKVSKTGLITDGKNMVFMGLSISITTIISSLSMYLLRLVISNAGGLEDVGLFTAGFTIVTIYVGLIINAMGTDYYPRLSAVNNDCEKFNKTINNQIEIALLLLGPILSFFIVFVHIGIIILYSSAFTPAEGMIYWAAYAVYFQVFSWCISYSFLAKGDGKMFVINELISSIYSFSGRALGYYLGDLEGVGIAFLLTYIIYSLQVYIICYRRYNVRIEKNVFALFFKQIPLITVCLALAMIGKMILTYSIGSLLFVFSFYYSYKELDKRVGIKSYLISKLSTKSHYVAPPKK